jgi:hypothetical protein
MGFNSGLKGLKELRVERKKFERRKIREKQD